MTFKGGYVQHHPHVYVIFWGTDWNNQTTAKENVLNLYKTLPGSSYGAILSQYFDYNGPISNDTALTSFTDTRIAHPGTTTEVSVREEVQYAIEHDPSWKAAWEAPNRYENQYVVFTPPLTTTKATEGCGYHGWLAGSWQTTFTYIPWPVEGCQRGLSAGNTMQVIASHEWAETATDPVASNDLEGTFEGLKGWAWGEGGEIGDICQTLSAAEHKEIAPNVFAQTLYDNFLLAANGTPCVVSDPTPQRFTVGMGPVSVSTASHSAILWGQLSPAGWPAGYRFELTGPGGTTFLPDRTGKGQIYPLFPLTLENAGNGPELFQSLAPAVLAEGLKGNTTYGVRFATLSPLTSPAFFNYTQAASAMFSGSTSFTTPDWRPQPTLEAPTEVKTGHATLHAQLNPEGYATTYRLEYGTSTSYGTSVPVPDANIGSGTSNVAIAQTIGVKGATTYHWRLVASNAEGTTTTSDQTFTTPDWRPALTTSEPSGLYYGNVAFKGTVNPSGFATHYRFEWGTEAEFKEGKYTHLTPVPDAEAGSGETAVAVSQMPEGLKGKTTYHLRLVAENAEGITTSADRPFTTADWSPEPRSVRQLGVGRTTAKLAGMINPKNHASSYHFEWGPTTSYGHSVPVPDAGVGSGVEDVEVTQTVEGLQQRATYHFRLVAENAEGKSASPDATFKTSTSGFVTGTSPAEIRGGVVGSAAFSFNGSALYVCETTPTISAMLSAPSDALASSSMTDGSCAISGLYSEKAALKMNGCNFILHPGPETFAGHFNGSFDLGPAKCGPMVLEGEICKRSFGAQNDLDASFENEGSGASAGIRFNAEASMKFTLEGPKSVCGPSGSGGFSGTWQLKAFNEAGSASNLHITGLFQTAPTATAKAATEVKAMTATLKGTVNPHLLETSYQFEYGPTTSYGSKAPAWPKAAGSGEADVEASQALEGLAPHTTYHYRLAATNAEGTTYSNDETMTTSVAHVSRIEAAKYPLTLGGTQDSSNKPALTFGGSRQFQCSGVNSSNKLSAGAAELALTPEYSGCTMTVLGSTVPATIAMNSCHYQAHIQNSGPPYAAKADVACTKEGDSIEARTYENAERQAKGESVCTYKIAPKAGIEGLGLANFGSGSEQGITATANLTLPYTRTQGTLGACGGASGNVTYTGAMTLKGTGSGEEPLAVYVVTGNTSLGLHLAGEASGEEAKQPRLEAEKYPAAIAGEQVPANPQALAFGSRIFSCAQVYSDGKLSATSKELALTPEYSGCTMTVLGSTVPATIAMNSCHYQAHIQNSGPPYAAKADVACTKEGDSIEARTYENAERQAKGESVCTYKIAPKAGIEGLGLANFGSGSEQGITATANLTLPYTRTQGTLGACGGASGNAAYTGAGTMWGFG